MSNQKPKTNGSLNGIKAVEISPAYKPTNEEMPKSKVTRRRKPAFSVQQIDAQETFNSKLLLKVLMEVKNGNFSVRMPIDEIGLNGKICDTMNEIITLNERMMLEFTKAGNIIGKQ